jgi:hypothetical protein
VDYPIKNLRRTNLDATPATNNARAWWRVSNAQLSSPRE